MKKEHSYNVLKVLQIIRALLLIILSITVLCTAIVGHCALPGNDYPLPYIVENENVSGFTDFLYQLPSSSVSRVGQFYVNAYENDNYFGYDYYENGNHCYAFYVPLENFTYSFTLSNQYELFDMTANRAEMTILNFAFIKGYTAPAPRGGYYFYGTHNENYTNAMTISFFAGSSKGDGTSLVPNLSSQNYVYNDDETKVVFGFGVPVPPLGEDDITNEEKPELSDYMPDWDNAPTFDNSSVENALESIFDYFVWFGGNIRDSLTGLGSFIVNSIGWQLQKVIDNIRSKIQEIKETILTVTDNIQNTIDYISQPLQVDEVVTAMQSTDIHTDIISVINLSNTAFGIFGTVAEPQNFTIPLDLTGISILHQTQPFYINLNWIIDARPYIRAFMWCIVTFGLLYSIVIGIPSMLKDGK